MPDDLADVYRSTYRSLVRFLYRKVWDAERAEDLAQEAFARALVHKPAHARGWLFVVAANMARDDARRAARERRHLTLLKSEPPASATPSDEALHTEGERSPARAAGCWRRSRREGQVNMSHVDDGTLHAYLDGELSPVQSQDVEAHIAQCPDCRDRLEEERALIARADELLGLAAPPDRATPPFRPGDPEPPVRLWWRVRLPLAWAATVVLALGAGMYFGPRALQREQPAADQRTSDLAAGRALPPVAAPETVVTHGAAPLAVRRTRAPAAPTSVVVEG